MTETYLEARNPNSIPYRPTWWEKYGLGARDDIASLREIPGNVIRVLKGHAFVSWAYELEKDSASFFYLLFELIFYHSF